MPSTLLAHKNLPQFLWAYTHNYIYNMVGISMSIFFCPVKNVTQKMQRRVHFNVLGNGDIEYNVKFRNIMSKRHVTPAFNYYPCSFCSTSYRCAL